MPASHHPVIYSREQAEVLALRILGFIAQDTARLERLLALTGLAADDLRARTGDPAFLGGVIDFLLEDEALLLEFTRVAEVPPEAPYAARRKLPGAPAEE